MSESMQSKGGGSNTEIERHTIPAGAARVEVIGPFTGGDTATVGLARLPSDVPPDVVVKLKALPVTVPDFVLQVRAFDAEGRELRSEKPESRS